MLLIGLTGSLATGKSTVSALLRAPPYNLPIIDADVLARQVVEPGTYGYKRVIQAFASTTPDLLIDPEKYDPSNAGGDGGTRKRKRGDDAAGGKPNEEERRPINRAALGRRVFGPSSERVRDRKILNGIIHPLVRLAMVKAVLYYYIRGYWAVLLDIPLLYESGFDVFCGVVVMVAVGDREIQMKRLRERDKGLSAQEAEERVGSQMQIEEKVERTEARGARQGKVLLNDGTREELERRVAIVYKEIKEDGGGSGRRIWLWGSPLVVVILGVWNICLSWWARRSWERHRERHKKL